MALLLITTPLRIFHFQPRPLLHNASRPIIPYFPPTNLITKARNRREVTSLCMATTTTNTTLLSELDPAFVVDVENRPHVNAAIEPLEEVPVIDLSGDIEGIVEEVGNACKEWGFFQVVNHGVPSHLLERMKETCKEFFDQPMEEKEKVRRDEVNPVGYHDGENTKNVRDWKEVYDFLIKGSALIPASPDLDCHELRTIANPWPESPSQFRVVCQEYAGEMEKVAFKVMEIICLSLGLPGGRLKGYFEEQISFLRINHYPPCPFPDLTLGCGRHKDFDFLTVLAQDDVGGLEIKRKSDGLWVPVKHTPDALIINVGDICQVWSNERYKSVEHRAVVNGEKERYSIALFLVPSHHVTVKPLEELVSDEDPPKYLPYNWGKFYATRNRSDYKKQNVDNIQISDFKVPI